MSGFTGFVRWFPSMVVTVIVVQVFILEVECQGMDEDCFRDCRINSVRDCVFKSQMCDGNRDCDDGSDEENCPEIETTSTRGTPTRKVTELPSTRKMEVASSASSVMATPIGSSSTLSQITTSKHSPTSSRYPSITNTSQQRITASNFTTHEEFTPAMPHSTTTVIGSVVTPSKFQTPTDKSMNREISDFQPSVGPVSGGTRLSISGKFFNTDNVTIFIANKPCRIIRPRDISDDDIACFTPSVDKPISSVVTMVFKDVNETTLVSGKVFSYLPDPEIRSIEPLRQFQGGGQIQTITGENFHIIAQPEFVVRAVTTLKSWTDFRSKCEVLSSTTMTCPSPTISLDAVNDSGYTLDGAGQRSGNDQQYASMHAVARRDVSDGCKVISSSPTTGEDVVFRVGFVLDGVETWNLQNIGRHLDSKYLSYTVAENPLFFKFPGKYHTSQINENSQHLVIKGRQLTCGARKEDFTVTVGKDYCKPIVSFQMYELTCILPSSIRNATVNSHFSVKVKIGTFDRMTYDIGYLQYSEMGALSGADASNSPWFKAIVVITVFLVVIIVLVTVLYVLRRRARYGAHKFSQRQDEEECFDLQPVQPVEPAEPVEENTFENAKATALARLDIELRLSIKDVLIDSERLELNFDNVLGRGSFGQVVEGTLLPVTSGEPRNEYTHQKVAVKLLKHNAQPDEVSTFLEEGLLMKGLLHPNVLTLVGVSIDQYGVPMIALPYMHFGNLKSYVEDETRDLTVKDLISLGKQVASGMAYISDTHRMVHRDLAARNCMVDEYETVKVGDFGLSRDVYEREYYVCTDSKAKLPAKWMAPECFRRQRFDTKTDVWAFGVLLWELMTRGENPYAAIDNWDLVEYLERGRRLEQPPNTPEKVYEIMQKCWLLDSSRRPDFKSLVQMLDDCLQFATCGTDSELYLIPIEVTYDYADLPRRGSRS
ncbi:hepatocyte growth factor receptor-like isoform X2 [Ptychodera flava]|uniref:hepatocyte growth factor receptor-like isoform X2 n=1 Tax=Ptychodera flava TaxID=63121 RepID=UPI00396AAF8D